MGAARIDARLRSEYDHMRGRAFRHAAVFLRGVPTSSHRMPFTTSWKSQRRTSWKGIHALTIINVRSSAADVRPST